MTLREDDRDEPLLEVALAERLEGELPGRDDIGVAQDFRVAEMAAALLPRIRLVQNRHPDVSHGIPPGCGCERSAVRFILGLPASKNPGAIRGMRGGERSERRGSMTKGGRVGPPSGPEKLRLPASWVNV